MCLSNEGTKLANPGNKLRHLPGVRRTDQEVANLRTSNFQQHRQFGLSIRCVLYTREVRVGHEKFHDSSLDTVHAEDGTVFLKGGAS